MITKSKRLIPPPWINYNYSGPFEIKSYKEEYKAKGLKQYNFFRELLNRDNFSVLDFGCGFSPLGSYLKINENQVYYTGVEPDNRAYIWCKKHFGNVNNL